MKPANAAWPGSSTLRGGRSRSRQRRSAVVSPSFARSIAFRVSTSASPSSSASTASVVLLRAPRGLPLGFPLWPLRKRGPCFVSVFSSILAPNCQLIEHAPAYRHGMLWPWREKDEDHEHDRCPIFLWDGV